MFISLEYTQTHLQQLFLVLNQSRGLSSHAIFYQYQV